MFNFTTMAMKYLVEAGVIKDTMPCFAKCAKIRNYLLKQNVVEESELPTTTDMIALYQMYQLVCDKIILKDLFDAAESYNTLKIDTIYLNNPLKEILSKTTFELEGVTYHVKAPKYTINDIVWLELNNGLKLDLPSFYKYLVQKSLSELRGIPHCKVISVQPPVAKWYKLSEIINKKLNCIDIKYVKNMSASSERRRVSSVEKVNGKYVKTTIEVPKY